MRRLSILAGGLIGSAVLATSLLAAPPAAFAASRQAPAGATPGLAASDGAVDTSTATYELVPARGLIHVTVHISITNRKPNDVRSYPCTQTYFGIPYTTTCTDTTRYYFYSFEVAVEVEAGKVTASSNAGAVSQSVASQDEFYRYVKLTYPKLYYGQTRALTVSYDIPGAAPRSEDWIRAGKAYAAFCVTGQGGGTGTIQAIVPSGYTVHVTSGSDMTASTSGGKQVFSSGLQNVAYEFWSCLEANNAGAFSSQNVTASGHGFEIRAWPEDQSWASRVKSDIVADVSALQSMIGLPLPDHTISIEEASDSQLGDYAGLYDPLEYSATVGEQADASTVAHELSHIWFNQNLFDGKWLSEGFAGYAEKVAGAGNFEPCTEPGSYPGDGSPDLTSWLMLRSRPTKTEEAVSTYQYAASCYIISTIAAEIGADRLRTVLQAGDAGEIAYLGRGAAEKVGSSPIAIRAFIDLVDERGMVPAGHADLDSVQTLLQTYLASPSQPELDARSKARAAYHALQTSAKGWAMPLAIRKPMSQWRFDEAGTAMDVAKKVVAERDELARLVPEAKLDGSSVQQRFEGAQTKADLDAVLAVLDKQLAAAHTYLDARSAAGASRSPFQQVGLFGADVQKPLDRSLAALQAVKPDDATAAANEVTSTISGAESVGQQRVAAAVGGLLVVLLLLVLAIWLVRRRRSRVVVVADPAAAFALLTGPPVPADAAGLDSGGAVRETPAGESAPAGESVPASQFTPVGWGGATWPGPEAPPEAPAGDTTPPANPADETAVMGAPAGDAAAADVEQASAEASPATTDELESAASAGDGEPDALTGTQASESGD